MQKDMAVLPTLSVEDTDGDVARLFQISLNGAGYEAWLSERAHYIISQDLDMEKSIKPLGVAVYPEGPAGTREEVKVAPPERPRNNKVVVVMSNLGAGLYSAGKMSKIKLFGVPVSPLLGVTVPGFDKVKVDSPRSGIFSNLSRRAFYATLAPQRRNG